MIRAVKLYTGADNRSHVEEGSIAVMQDSEVLTASFQEAPAGSALDWHDAPHSQYVVTLSGMLEFTTRDGETFQLAPGDVLLAEDTTGSGHRWKLIDDQPWRRIYITLKPGSGDLFVTANHNDRTVEGSPAKQV